MHTLAMMISHEKKSTKELHFSQALASLLFAEKYGISQPNNCEEVDQ